MTSQPAITINGVRNVVSNMSGIEKPSTPRKYSTLKALIHGMRSTNCIAAVDASKFVYKERLIMNVKTEIARANQRSTVSREPSADSRRPVAMTRSPPTIGIQINILSSPTVFLRVRVG